MKNSIFIFLILSIDNQLFMAQNVPEFQYSLYVEDARGKKDSIILGYDRTAAYATLESRFGEIDIKQNPFDSLLEMRATEATNRFNIKYHSKKVIAKFEGICPDNASSSIITLLIRAKYYPIKFSWNKALFTDPCRGQSILLNSEAYFAIDPPFERGADSIYSVTYMKNQMDKVEKFERRTPSGQPNPFYHYIFLAPTNNGQNDTIWTYSTVFRSDLINKVTELNYQKINIYPNPSLDFINLDFIDYETGHIEIYDLAGRNIKTIKVESSIQLKIDVHDFNVGMYFLQFKAGDGKTYISKFVKS